MSFWLDLNLNPLLKNNKEALCGKNSSLMSILPALRFIYEQISAYFNTNELNAAQLQLRLRYLMTG